MIYKQKRKIRYFFVDFTRVYITWNKCHFFQIIWSCFRISLGYCLSEFSQVTVLCHLSRKVKTRNFSSFFQLFAVLIKIEIRRLFPLPGILCSASLIGNCQKWREIKCSLGLDIFCHLSTLHLNLAPCYIIQYFESTVDLKKSQVKARS